MFDTYPIFQDFRNNNDVYTGTVDAIPQDVQNALNDWFDTREICDDGTNFIRFFQRILNRDYERFRQLLRIEPGIAQYDWLVQQYDEEQRYLQEEGTRTGTDSLTKTGTRSGTSALDGKTVTTPDLKTVSSGNTSETSNETATGKTTTENEAEAGSRAVSKQNPQSISYSGATDGEIPALDWKYPGTQTQDESHSTGNGETDTENKTNGSTTGETLDQTTQTGTTTTKTDDETTITETNTASESGTKNETSSGEHLEQKIHSGRGTSPAELLRKATSYIKGTSAIMWLIEELEPCFIGIYDI